jgi:all-trans-8'-apo-beta-carotenal 15,15'-oxygenase
MKLTRRQFLQAGIALGAAALLREPSTARSAPHAVQAPEWMTLLGRSEQGGRDYVPRIDGAIPKDLQGSLYRNGPGLFERAGVRKPHLLDGDGLVQRLSFREGLVKYQNAFVRTRKLTLETEAGRYRYATWSQRAPGGILANIGGGYLSQAGVTVYPFGGRLYAFDEVSPPYALDPEGLRTLGEAALGPHNESFQLKAHTKRDPVSGDWLLFGVSNGAAPAFHAVTYSADGTLKSHHIIASPRRVYVHDFFATESHLVLVLHPLWFSPWRFLAGLDSFIESLSWRGADGNLVVVVPRGGGTARLFEVEGSFMWHALNAYERGHEIIADFVGYDAPDHFLGDDARWRALMRGEIGIAEAPGRLRRYRIDLSAGRLREEILDAGPLEFPFVDPRVATRAHRVGYFAAGPTIAFQSAVRRIDLQTGATQSFDFGPTTAVGEPVLAARTGGAVPDEGWLIAQCLDGATGRTYFAVFDAQRVADGPTARIWLSHHVPISFHGAWLAT